MVKISPDEPVIIVLSFTISDDESQCRDFADIPAIAKNRVHSRHIHRCAPGLVTAGKDEVGDIILDSGR